MGKHKHVDTNQHAAKNPWVNKETEGETRQYPKTNWKIKTQLSNIYMRQQKQF